MRLLLLLALSLTFTQCRSRGLRSEPSDIQNKNLAAIDFQVADKELVLTLDDGPGAGTKAIVEFLKKRQIPAIFFMTGVQVERPENLPIVKEIAAEPLFLIGNHSMHHSQALTTGRDWAVSEVRGADTLIAPLLGPHQKLHFLRPPYGFLVGSAPIISALNSAEDGQGAKFSKYIGPVHWDIGSELNQNYAADWACWQKSGSGTKRTVAQCRDGYLREIRSKQKGIILLHDIHKLTAEMLIGDGAKTGLIDKLLAEGYKFVPLNKAGDDYLVKTFGGPALEEEKKPEKPLDSISITGETDTGFTVNVANGDAVQFRFFVDGNLAEEKPGPEASFTYQNSPGVYQIEVKGYDAEDKPLFSYWFHHRIGNGK